MVCLPTYAYSEIFNTYGAKLRTIIVDPASIITEPEMAANPHPIYESQVAYDADDDHLYKGMVVWHAQRYYAAVDRDKTDDAIGYDANAGFYVIPTFGSVHMIPNIEYKQTVALTFDSNGALDQDPFGTKIVGVIDTLVNNNYKAVEQYGNEVELADGRKLYIRLVTISDPINIATSTFTRRTAVLELRYCHCF